MLGDDVSYALAYVNAGAGSVRSCQPHFLIVGVSNPRPLDRRSGYGTPA
jgi:hypothetical protein